MQRLREGYDAAARQARKGDKKGNKRRGGKRLKRRQNQIALERFRKAATGESGGLWGALFVYIKIYK